MAISWGFDIGASRDFDTQYVNLTFWPTAAAFTQDRLLVAGRTPKNKTKVISFEFSYPPLPNDPQVQYAALIASQTVIYNDSQPGQVDVLHMWKNQAWPGPAGAVFLQFGDSRDVKQLDLATGNITLGLPGSAEPLLASDRYATVTAIDHPQHGLFYLFLAAPNCPEELPLILADADRDGVLDGHYTLSGQEIAAIISDGPTIFD